MYIYTYIYIYSVVYIHKYVLYSASNTDKYNSSCQCFNSNSFLPKLWTANSCFALMAWTGSRRVGGCYTIHNRIDTVMI